MKNKLKVSVMIQKLNLSLICCLFLCIAALTYFSDLLFPSANGFITGCEGQVRRINPSSGEPNPPVVFHKTELKIGSKTLNVEIADTPERARLGLMYRTTLKDNSGMFFIFDRESVLTLWMKNTFIDLDIGFFNKERVLIEIQEMKGIHSSSQKNIPSISSQSPVQFALEVPRCWFKKNEITLGTTFSLTCLASYPLPYCE